MNSKVLFNDGWTFAKYSLEGLSEREIAAVVGEEPFADLQHMPELEFEPIDVPHDWLIYDTQQLYENSIGWYRKTYKHEHGDGEQVLIYFDGVYMDSALYVNGQLAGIWKYGYSAFEHNVTDFLVAGENEFIVKVVHQSPNSRWYSGAGIYRHVWLKRRGANHIVSDGVYISSRKTEAGWQVEIDTEVQLTEAAVLAHKLMYDGQVVAQNEATVDAADEAVANKQTMLVLDPQLWDIAEPHLYTLETQLLHSAYGQLLETVTHPVGFRTVMMDPQEGFMLNGVTMKLNGVCEHHDLGALGAAFNVQALRRRFDILKTMGVNAIRTAHNMPAKELMALADEMGFLIVSEAFDMWERPKTTYDYARFFPEWAAKDVRSWVRRDRNHPSLIMWSIGNEIYDTHASERGQQVTQMLKDEVEKYDPRGNAVVTIGSNYMPWENAQKCADIVKYAGYNYAEKYYHQHHAAHPDWIIYGSETASVVQSRGVYHFPYKQSLLADDDEQCSALGNSTTSWGASSHEFCIISERDAPFSLGQFIWTGFDYIGEPTPYHTKNAYFGQIDTATFVKDSYYFYQASWTDYKTKPMVHILPYWDFNIGQLIDVRVFSNAPRIELQFNGTTIGTYDIDHEHGSELAGWWQIPYEPGELKAIAYDEAGQVIATDVKRSFGDAAHIVLQADKHQMVADGTDVIFVEIGMVDEAGRVVENANNRVSVAVTGAGRLVGLDNGDSTDVDPYKGMSRRLFNGKLMAIVAAGLSPGPIVVSVSSQGLPRQTIELEAVASEELVSGLSAQMSNVEMPVVMGCIDEVPVRKIEIISDADRSFHAARREMIVRAQLYPAQSSYQEISWAVVNDAAIETNIATVEPISLHEVKVTAWGDGDFRLRCMSNNGTDKTKLISELEFTVTGLGTAYKDPYTFLSAGLYDYSKGEVTSGNEKGIATARDGETVVGFRDIDFGPHGSDTVTLPIFALSGDRYDLQIWAGIPGEADSELLADTHYQKKMIWNVYQEETYQLSRKLRGVNTICFVLQDKVHIKGFTFAQHNRAFARNEAVDGDRIYGDTFTLTDHAVEGIGNNVSLTFEQLDFGTTGASKIVIHGRSPIEKNTIQIRVAGEAGGHSQLVEFTHSEGYETREFDIDLLTGVQDVTFVFLPGSHFDFGWFRFEK